MYGKLFEGITDGYGDAIRHCYWCALNQVSAGLNSPNAKKFGDAHENTSKNEINAKAMDLHNNSVGYYLGNQAIIPRSVSPQKSFAEAEESPTISTRSISPTPLPRSFAR